MEMGCVCLGEGKVRGKVFVNEDAHHFVYFVGFGVESIVYIEEQYRTSVWR